MPVYYLDSSAIVKLIVAEAESPALTRFVQTSFPITCDLARTEVQRAVACRLPEALAGATEVLRHLAIMTLSGGLYDRAGRLQPAFLRSLDALHVTAALDLGSDLTAFVTYDQRLAEAARLNGLPVASPSAA